MCVYMRGLGLELELELMSRRADVGTGRRKERRIRQGRFCKHTKERRGGDSFIIESASRCCFAICMLGEV